MGQANEEIRRGRGRRGLRRRYRTAVRPRSAVCQPASRRVATGRTARRVLRAAGAGSVRAACRATILRRVTSSMRRPHRATRRSPQPLIRIRCLSMSPRRGPPLHIRRLRSRSLLIPIARGRAKLHSARRKRRGASRVSILRPNGQAAKLPSGLRRVPCRCRSPRPAEPGSKAKKPGSSLLGGLGFRRATEPQYKKPTINMLKRPAAAKQGPEFTQTVLRGNARLLEDVLADFGVKGEVARHQARSGRDAVRAGACTRHEVGSRDRARRRHRPLDERDERPRGRRARPQRHRHRVAERAARDRAAA